VFICCFNGATCCGTGIDEHCHDFHVIWQWLRDSGPMVVLGEGIMGTAEVQRDCNSIVLCNCPHKQCHGTCVTN
jgi:hypothetical protein